MKKLLCGLLMVLISVSSKANDICDKYSFGDGVRFSDEGYECFVPREEKTNGLFRFKCAKLCSDPNDNCRVGAYLEPFYRVKAESGKVESCTSAGGCQHVTNCYVNKPVLSEHR